MKITAGTTVSRALFVPAASMKKREKTENGLCTRCQVYDRVGLCDKYLGATTLTRVVNNDSLNSTRARKSKKAPNRRR